MDPYMYQRQYSNGSNDGCFYEGNGNGHAGGDARPVAVVMNPQGRRMSSEARARRHHGGLGSFSMDDEMERPHTTGPAPFRSATDYFGVGLEIEGWASSVWEILDLPLEGSIKMFR